MRIRLYRHECDKEEPWSAVRFHDEVKKEHPIIFSARGSHGSYLEGGATINCKFGDFNVNDTTYKSDDPDHHWKTWNNLRDVTKQPWFGFGGAWGDVKADTWRSGPLGPGWKKPSPW